MGTRELLMVPTEILGQHFETIHSLFLKEGIKVDFTGGNKLKREKTF